MEDRRAVPRDGAQGRLQLEAGMQEEFGAALDAGVHDRGHREHMKERQHRHHALLPQPEARHVAADLVRVGG